MATAVTDIKSTNWQLSTGGFGFIAEGLADVRQCLDILLRTYKGSDSLRAEFGCGIFQYIDQPVNVAIPNMKRAIIEAVAIWETRVKLVSITHYLQESQIFFNITYKLVDQDLIDSLLLNATTNTVPADTGLILQAFYPYNQYGRQYNISLALDNIDAAPAPPPAGFASLNDVYAWVNNNWGAYGKWVQLTDRLILYADKKYKTGSISIYLLTAGIRVTALIPALPEGEQYGIDFTADGAAPVPAYSGSPETIEGLLLWAQTYWAAYGDWTIETGGVDVLGDFSGLDFSGIDFLVGHSQDYYLVLNSTILNTAELEVLTGILI